MALLGNRNWYLPAWLNWLPTMHIEGTPAHLPAEQPAFEPFLAD
jgi:RND superfamily putative drug exporter